MADAEVSARFYTALGFTIVQTNPDGYTTLRSGPAIIALSPVSTWLPLRWFGFLRHPPLGTEIVLYTRQLQALRERLVEGGYAPGAIALQPWGLRDFRVNDHDGYYVRVTEGLALPRRIDALPMMQRRAQNPRSRWQRRVRSFRDTPAHRRCKA